MASAREAQPASLAELAPPLWLSGEAHYSHTHGEGLETSAELWARYAEVAAQRPALVGEVRTIHHGGPSQMTGALATSRMRNAI